ncbi:3'-5' exonuclease [Klebsiella pneumoniae]|uniref:3'-5' exonuclease n=1 Tax=Klebsiella pneumoniae TaxID=573 RepID=UPI001C8F221A|nr:3'-5' exonuclease [Klebsiella pneumoniae]
MALDAWACPSPSPARRSAGKRPDRRRLHCARHRNHRLGDDAEICEITILDVTGAPILDTLVRPTRPIPVEATAIHKITDAMVASAPSWPEVAEQYAAAVAGRTVVAYNVAF